MPRRIPLQVCTGRATNFSRDADAHAVASDVVPFTDTRIGRGATGGIERSCRTLKADNLVGTGGNDVE